jgi:hypothetical protein
MKNNDMLDKVAAVADLYAPAVGLLCKLGSIVDAAIDDLCHDD